MNLKAMKIGQTVVAGQEHFDIFMEAYSKNLAAALEKFPDQYAWPKSELPQVIERMKAAIKKGSFNKDSHAFKATCKELKIPYTYQGIKSYLEQ